MSLHEDFGAPPGTLTKTRPLLLPHDGSFIANAGQQRQPLVFPPNVFSVELCWVGILSAANSKLGVFHEGTEFCRLFTYHVGVSLWASFRPPNHFQYVRIYSSNGCSPENRAKCCKFGYITGLRIASSYRYPDLECSCWRALRHQNWHICGFFSCVYLGMTFCGMCLKPLN